MSQAKTTFDAAIQDAEELLGHFNRINTHPPPPNAEVLKRAGLIMAFTAWETYVEDRVREVLDTRLADEGGSCLSTSWESTSRSHGRGTDTTLQRRKKSSTP